MAGMHRLSNPRAPILVDGSALTLFAVVATFFVMLGPFWVWVTVNGVLLAVIVATYLWRRHRHRM